MPHTRTRSLEEARVRAERAAYELDAAIDDAFARYDELALRLTDFDERLADVRARLTGGGR